MYQRSLVVAVLLAALSVCASIHAEDGAPAAPPNKGALQRELHQAFAQQDYKTALEKCQALVAIEPEDNTAHYNLACAQARLGKKDDAFASLAKAIEKGYNDPGHMKEDEDLNSLHDDKRFEELSAKARENEKKGGWEKGAEIEGVKTVEDMPEGGLRYRLRMSPDATKDKPNRLVVWLHPSGGSMNQVAEAMSKFFIKRGFALLVLTKKQWAGWAGPEMDALIKKTLPEVGKIEGLDAARPIFMGFSAGGQAALSQWGDDPTVAGGLVLDAAYPIDMQAYMQRQTKVMAIPNNEAVKKVPMFVLVGDQDGGHQVWKKCEADWRKAGIPLTIEYVAGGRHQWLMGKSQTEALGKWLEEIAAGKIPADKPAATTDEKKTAPAAEAKKTEPDEKSAEPERAKMDGGPTGAM